MQVVTLTDLAPLTHYTVRVAAVGKRDQLSEWCLPLEFTTLDTTHTTGIHTTEASTVAVYPNPAHGAVTIEVMSPATVTLFTLSGRAVNTWEMDTGTMTIDLTTVPQGAYFVRVVTRNNVTVSKLIVE